MPEKVVKRLLIEERIEGFDYILDPLLVIEMVFYFEVFEEREGAIHIVLVRTVDADYQIIETTAREIFLKLDFAVFIIDLSSIFRL